LTLDEAGVTHARHGRLIPAQHVVAGSPEALVAGTEPVLLLTNEGRPVALARAEADGLRVVRGFRS
jgi:hypothetical protein